MIKSHRRSLNVMEGHRRSFPITRLTFQKRKVMDEWGGVVVMACRITVSAPVPVESHSSGL